MSFEEERLQRAEITIRAVLTAKEVRPIAIDAAVDAMRTVLAAPYDPPAPAPAEYGRSKSMDKRLEAQGKPRPAPQLSEDKHCPACGNCELEGHRRDCPSALEFIDAAPQPAEVTDAVAYLRKTVDCPACATEFPKTKAAIEILLHAVESQQAQVKAADALIEECAKHEPMVKVHNSYKVRTETGDPHISVWLTCTCGWSGKDRPEELFSIHIRALKGKSALAPQVLTVNGWQLQAVCAAMGFTTTLGLDQWDVFADKLNASLREPSR